METTEEKITWSEESRNLSDLTPANYNPRTLTIKEAQDLKNSLDKFGYDVIISRWEKFTGKAAQKVC